MTFGENRHVDSSDFHMWVYIAVTAVRAWRRRMGCVFLCIMHAWCPKRYWQLESFAEFTCIFLFFHKCVYEYVCVSVKVGSGLWVCLCGTVFVCGCVYLCACVYEWVTLCAWPWHCLHKQTPAKCFLCNGFVFAHHLTFNLARASSFSSPPPFKPLYYLY